MTHRILIALAFSVLSCAQACTAEKTTTLRGEYAEIDTSGDMKAIQTLTQGTQKQRARMAQKVINNSSEYCPAVFFHLSHYLFDQGHNNQASFWLYAGRIRMWYDVKRCADPSVGDAVEVMNRQLPDLLRLQQFKDLDNARKQMKKAIAWDEKTPRDYDARWIALHGIRASLPASADGSAEPLLIPEDDWDALAKRHRKEYLSIWLEDMENLTHDQLKQIQDRIEELESGE